MNSICKFVPKRDHTEKTHGTAKYVCDYPTTEMLIGRILRSTVARANVKKVSLPALPQDYYYVDKNDIPGKNNIHIVLDDMPVFADETVEYIGDAIGMLVGPNEEVVSSLLDEIQVEYEELTPILNPKESDVVFFNYNYEKGDIDKAFADADKVYEENFETGLQEHMYMETNGIIAQYINGEVEIRGSIQCPYYVHRAVTGAIGIPSEKVNIITEHIGGSFGGKEDFPSILGSQAAVAAYKAANGKMTGKPVRVVFDRSEDIESTSKRHPSFCNYKVAVKNGKVTGMRIDVLYDAGAYTTLTPVVLQRGIIGSSGVYDIPNLKVNGKATKTNTVPNGAFRGFGGPQTFFAVEMMMTHIAKDLGIDSVDFKRNNLAKKGDLTSTSGKHHFPVPLPKMLDDVIKASGYRIKMKEYENQIGRYRKGIGMAAVYHGAGFTGNGERDIIKAVAKLHKDKDGNVEILTANTDMGQGLATTFSKIIAKELDLPFERIIIKPPETKRVPDSGPTVASRSLMIVGELIRRCAARLKKEWIDGEEQTITERFQPPDFMIPFDMDTFSGDAYPAYSWAVSAIEVEIDTLTGCIDVLNAWGSFDVGTPIDETIVIGQMEGGLLQSIGYGMMEKMTHTNGRIRNNKFSDYIIPTATDVPNLKIMLHVEEYPEGPFGAKGAGELPNVVGAPATIEAIQNALGIKLNKTPFLPEDVVSVISEVTK